MRYLYIILFIILLQPGATAQVTPFKIVIEPLTIPGLEGVQTCAVGKYEGKWLIIGGRKDGLHRKQPWATFDVEGQNKQLTVVDPLKRKKWSAPINSMDQSIQDQLSSTNMEFHQEGDFLYLIGGYGYSKRADDHITYPKLTAIKVSGVIKAVINGAPFRAFFRQLEDEKFAVTGGYLNKIYNTYYLTGGQRFDGRYNPMGHHTYNQEYTNAIKKFEIFDDGTHLYVKHLDSMIDTLNLHRRDFNVIPQILPDGSEGLTTFSGVFRTDADLPYLNCVNIYSSGYKVNDGFKQYYNHYHCATIPIYSLLNKEMHNLFFGGIAQYSDSSGVLIQNDNVPFVKTIARVTRDKSGKMSEYKLPVEMPDFLGAGSEFIRADGVPVFENGVIKLDEIHAGSTLIGYIFGGIKSSGPEIFWINNGSQSTAANMIYKVYLIKNNQ